MSDKLKNMSEEEKKKYEKAEMVGWYDPSQLFSTGVMTTISTTIGEYADPRMSAPAPHHRKPFDYSRELKQTEEDGEFLAFDLDENDNEISHQEREEIWIDYAADVGDGWNSTYGVAYNLGQPTLNAELKKFNKETGKEEVLQEETTRGEILIFGGDGVYPTAEATQYESRLIMPYRMAFRAGGTDDANEDSGAVDLKRSPHLFALPGNHDWYDSLVAFRKLFCSHIFNGRRFANYEEKDADGKTILRGGWRTRQRRSYFALKLPNKWWLLAVDMQLSHNIDVAQLEYFEEIILKQMDEGDKVILCVPEPYWVKAIKYEGMTEKFEEKEASIEKLEALLRDREIRIWAYIAGDLHHYRRFADKNGAQKITAGGGGAFLHPTHDFDFEKQEKELKKKEKKTEKEIERSRFKWQKNYPEFKDSRKKDWKCFLFPIKNPWFGMITAVIYALLAWLLHGKLDDGAGWVNRFIEAFRGSGNVFSTFWAFVWDALRATINELIHNPLAAILALLLLIAVVFFTDTNKKLYKWFGGLLHGLSHLKAIFFLGWGAYLLSEYFIGKYHVVSQTYQNLIWLACVLIVPAIGGYIIGSIIMGVYLFVSLHLFGRHDNEAFSALKIEDYKNFLRMRINSDGLTIYSFKIGTVAKDWEDVIAGGEIIYRTPKEENKAELIEKIEVKG